MLLIKFGERIFARLVFDVERAGLVISAQVAEVTITKLVVLISVHVGEDLYHLVAFKAHLDFFEHVSEVSESDVPSIAHIKGSERRGNLAKLVDPALHEPAQHYFELAMLLRLCSCYHCEQRVIGALRR